MHLLGIQGLVFKWRFKSLAEFNMGCTHVLACGVRKIHGSGPWVGQAEKHLPPSVPPSS
jgi:hypothetical protein